MSTVNAANVWGFKMAFSDVAPLMVECAFDRWAAEERFKFGWTNPRSLLATTDVTDEPEPLWVGAWDRITYWKAKVMFEFGLMLIRFSEEE